jgi:GT2 family glycosyltransferase
VRGVTYGTFRESEDGYAYPEPSMVARDFSRMAGAGINAVRTYTVPPRRVLDEAQRHGLGVLVGLPWEQHVDFLSDRGRVRSIQRRVATGVAACAAHPAVLGYAIGNEIPASIVRWRGRRRIEGFLRTLYEAAKTEDPGALVTYPNFPTTEYLQLPFLDFLAFNVFLESPDRLDAYVARLQNLAGERPLVLTELGLDSRSAGLATQAASVGAQIRTAFAGGCAGAFVFSWTDEWHRSGEDVLDWEFGLTSRERRPKPALMAATRAFSSVPVALGERAPSFSVVVCVYNAESTIEDCLDGIAALDYPEYEVIVVDDGSTDDTAELASRYDVRLVRTENRGLSRARNTGIEAAKGDIVAFIDGDARPDPHWLRYLAQSFTTHDFVGVGGPNIQPAGDPWPADCVAAAPGGPIHVLLSDRVAEHIPGCNMAFWRRVLLEVGGFDPRYRVAGDDVDLCWRLQERGWTLGFHAGAMVWHHHRDSIAAFWRQQRGYGRAEALLEAKWPAKYNSAGHVTWGGRVYGRGVPFFRRSRVYHGLWGSAPFQPLHMEPAGLVASLATTPEWFLLIAALSVVSAAGLLWPPLLLATPLLVFVVASVVIQAARRSAALTRGRGGSISERLRFGATTFLLHMLQPLARLAGRVGAGLTPWRLNHGPGYPLPFGRMETAWTEEWRDPKARTAAVESALRRAGARVRRGGPYAGWDLDIHYGPTGRARVRMAVEEHGDGRQLWRFRIQPRIARVSVLGAGLSAALGVLALADGATALAALLGTGAALIFGRTIIEAAASVAAAQGAIRGETL